MATSSAPPVLFMGELHTESAHYRIERDALCYLQGSGYTKVALELPRDMDGALHTYLRSPRREEDYRDYAQAWVALRFGPKGGPSDIERFMKDPWFLTKTWQAEDAADLGYAVEAVDISVGEFRRTDALGDKVQNVLRNQAMAERVAASADQGVIVIVGHGHMVSREPSTIPGELKAHGIACETFSLGVHGYRQEVYRCQAWEKMLPPVDHVVHSGEQIGAILREELRGRPFDRPTPVPIPSATWTRRADVLAEGISLSGRTLV